MFIRTISQFKAASLHYRLHHPRPGGRGVVFTCVRLSWKVPGRKEELDGVRSVHTTFEFIQTLFKLVLQTLAKAVVDASANFFAACKMLCLSNTLYIYIYIHVYIYIYIDIHIHIHTYNVISHCHICIIVNLYRLQYAVNSVDAP